MATIALEGLEFFAYHGVYASEIENGNQFVVDLWLELGPAGLPADDALENTLDYCEVYDCVANVMREQRVNLLETLLLGIGGGLLKRFEAVKVARVRVSKLNPPIGGPCLRAYLEHSFVRP